MDSLKVGDRVGLRKIEVSGVQIGTIYKIDVPGFIYCTTDSGTVFIGHPDYDEIKPVIKTNGG